MLLAGLAACSKGDYFEGDGDIADKGYYGYAEIAGGPGDGGVAPGEGTGTGDNQDHSGVVTAGEWNDLDNWNFWSGLMTGDDYKDMASYWGFYTSGRVAVEVTSDGTAPVVGAKVDLVRSGKAIWSAVTDKFGRAELFVDFFQKGDPDASSLSVTIDGKAQEGPVEISAYDTQSMHKVNKFTVTPTVTPADIVDIAFVVDATGSMFDEIDFLKSDLKSILDKVAEMETTTTIRTAALFYRDEGDEYVTKYNDFSKKFDDTIKFIDKQRASGGGDYPEAVHTALDVTLNELKWDNSARAHLVFMLLDAPAHQDHDGVLDSLHSSMEKYAAKGIKIIPVAASGVDKNTEFMCRFFAISTGGTYVFLTNDSGVGGDHITPSVGQYQVEKLNELIVRLITKYI